MTLKFAALGAFTLVLLAGCADMGGTNSGATQVGALDTDVAAASPQGIVAAQLASPNNASECARLALVLQDSERTAVERQTAVDDRERLGCPS